MSNITLDNVNKWKDWGMALIACSKSEEKEKDKKPAYEWNGKYNSDGKKQYVWKVDQTVEELASAKRIAVIHQPDKKGAIGKSFLTVDFDDPDFVASSFSSLFPVSFTIGKKDIAGAIRATHIEYEIDPEHKPKKKVSFENSIEVLSNTCSIIGGVDRHTIWDVQPVRLLETHVEHVLQLVKVVNFMQHVAKAFPAKGGRDESFLRLAGALAHTELSTELKEKVVEKLCEVIGDDEVNKRVKKVQYQERQLAAGVEIANIKSLCQNLNVNNTSLLAKAFDELKPDAVEEDAEEEIDYKRTISFADLDDFLTTDFPQPSYIIEPLVSDQSIVQIVGASGVGKTMFGLAIAGAIATANGLLGMTSVGGPRPVLYVEGELPGSDIQIRINGMLKAIDKSCSKNFYVSSLQQQLKINDRGFTPIQTEQGLIEIENAIVEIKKRTGKMPVVFIDNISCLASGLKENDADAWSPIINKFVKWKNMGSTIFYFHHLNKGNDSSGSTMQHRTIDMVIRMRKPDNKQKIKTFKDKGVQAIVDFPKWRLHDNSQHSQEHMLICEDWKWEKLPVLTSDELEIVRMYNEDLDVKEMAKEIDLAEKTIYKKIKHLKDKGVIKDGTNKETTDRKTKEIC